MHRGRVQPYIIMRSVTTTVNTEIQIPLCEIESPVLPTGWHVPGAAPPPRLQYHAMVSSTQKPRVLDNQDESESDQDEDEDELTNSNIPNTIVSSNSISGTGSIDYPVLISDTEYREFCSQMNTLIQQYDVNVHQRKRISYYRHACFLIISAVAIHIYFAKLAGPSDVNFLQLLFATGYFYGLVLLESVIMACVTHSSMQRIKREMAQLYDSVNELCSDRSFRRTVLVPPPASLPTAESSINAVPVTVTFQMIWKFDIDLFGRYHIMDSVQMLIDKTIITASNASIDTTVPITVTKSTVSLSMSSIRPMPKWVRRASV